MLSVMAQDRQQTQAMVGAAQRAAQGVAGVASGLSQMRQSVTAQGMQQQAMRDQNSQALFAPSAPGGFGYFGSQAHMRDLENQNNAGWNWAVQPGWNFRY